MDGPVDLLPDAEGHRHSALVGHLPRLHDLDPASVRAAVRLPVRFGDGYAALGTLFSFNGLTDRREHVVLGLGSRESAEVPLVRMHSECLTGDVFGSQRCDCGPQLREAVELIAEAGGYLIYMRQEGRDIGLYNKIDAYALQEQGLDTFQANRALGLPDDARDYTAAAQMLHALDVGTVDLLTNNPDKALALDRLGIEVRKMVPTGLFQNVANLRYLQTKATEGHHTLDV